jgi:uncharacterized repeat protein (TIGR01451 family)/MYXO-CTERM domain-containing protein
LATLVAGLSLLPQPAEAQLLRFTTTEPGNVIAVGNTLGLAKQPALNGPGTSDAIGTFITLDAAAVDDDLPPGTSPWPAGTTSNWNENGSEATLEIPREGSVLYAELVWGGSHAYGAENVSAFLDTPVTLSANGESITVTPDAATAVTEEALGSFVIRYYMRSGDVTAFVQEHGSGTYAVEGVPATQDSIVDTTNAAGWSIIVAYRFDGDPIRNMSVFVGDTTFVDEDATVDYEVDGFCAPPSGDIAGTIAIATVEGDANRQGDQLAIGETPASVFVNLSGPNNPADNFFCSQINGPDGLIDTSGSFGNLNHAPGTNVSGGRQGWDIAHVELSSDAGQLSPNQTSAVLRTQTLSDSYMPLLAGIAIDVNAPKFLYDASTTEVDKDEVEVGDSFKVTITLVNEGSAPANGVSFFLPLANGLALDAFSTNGASGDILGNPVTLADLGTGVDMGDLAPDEQRVVVVDLSVEAPQSTDIRPEWHYSYTMCTAGGSMDEQFQAQIVTVDYNEDVSTGTAQGGGNQGGGTATNVGGGNADGGAGGGDGDATAYTEGGGCNCLAAGASDDRRAGAALALGLLGLVLARRRRRG